MAQLVTQTRNRQESSKLMTQSPNMSNLYHKICTCAINGETVMCLRKTKDSPCVKKIKENVQKILEDVTKRK